MTPQQQKDLDDRLASQVALSGGRADHARMILAATLQAEMKISPDAAKAEIDASAARIGVNGYKLPAGQPQAPVNGAGAWHLEDPESWYLSEKAKLAARRRAERELDAAEYLKAAGERRFMPFSEVEQIPQPDMLLNGMLTAGGFYGLAGPPEAGKSLMLRDWLCTLAARGTPCLYAVSEGQFDLIDRFGAHPAYPAARANLAFFDGPLSLASAEDVRWLAGKTDGRYGLAAFDMIYGFGLPDDDGTRGVAPVINGAKELARLTGTCVIVTGHPGHNGERRFRGSSMWRGSFDGEFHMAGGEFTCEKHKYSDKRRFRYPYSISYPHLRALGTTGQLDRAARQMQAIDEDRRMHPLDSENKRAERLAGQLGMHKDSVRKLIRGFRQAQADE